MTASTSREASTSKEGTIMNSGSTSDDIQAMLTKVRKNAKKTVENLSPEEPKVFEADPKVSPSVAMQFLEDLGDFDCSNGEEDRASAEAEATRSGMRTTVKGGQDEEGKLARDA